MTWTDASGDLWLFGGYGVDSVAAIGDLNDLWEFNPATGQWAWMGGSKTTNVYPSGPQAVYGTLGTPSADNVPGGRQAAVTWTDSKGNFWMFGGAGIDSQIKGGYLNDLWLYKPTTKQWTWMGGANTMTLMPIQEYGGQPRYGTLGTPDPANVPGGRCESVGWVDSDDHLWLFGGWGFDANGSAAELNDLWEFDPSTNEWTWISGSNQVSQAGTYGVMGTAAPVNTSGARVNASAWTDVYGRLWLFGGGWQITSTQYQLFNDLWAFDRSSRQWTWIAGSDSEGTTCFPVGNEPDCGWLGNYGQLAIPASANFPGSRDSAVGWTNTTGNLWLFGGQGFDASGNWGNLNDLWVMNASTAGWTWVGGADTTNAPGTYGTKGSAATTNAPGNRIFGASWTGKDGRLWLFGGIDNEATNWGYLNDLWVYQLPASVFPSAAAPTFSPQGGTFNATVALAILDSTPGAAIYYTTDGSAPTASSTPYTGAISVSSSQTIQAVAMADGYNVSPVVSASFTINLPSFTLGASTTSLAVSSGGQGTVSLSLAPTNGFKGTVSLSCSGLPSGATCSFNPSAVDLNAATSVALTFAAAARSAAVRESVPFATSLLSLAFVVCLMGWGKRVRMRVLVLLIVATGCLGLLNACGSGGRSSPTPTPTPTPTSTTSTVTVTATSGSIQQSVTIALTVN